MNNQTLQKTIERNLPQIDKSKVSWWWPTIDSVETINILLRRVSWYAVFCSSVTLLAVLYSLSGQAHGFWASFDAWNFLDVALYAWGAWAVRRYSMLAPVLMLIDDVATRVFQVMDGSFKGFDLLMEVLFIMILLNGLRAVYYHRTMKDNLAWTN
jgi:hypothetical protein